MVICITVNMRFGAGIHCYTDTHKATENNYICKFDILNVSGDQGWFCMVLKSPITLPQTV